LASPFEGEAFDAIRAVNGIGPLSDNASGLTKIALQSAIAIQGYFGRFHSCYIEIMLALK